MKKNILRVPYQDFISIINHCKTLKETNMLVESVYGIEIHGLYCCGDKKPFCFISFTNLKEAIHESTAKTKVVD